MGGGGGGEFYRKEPRPPIVTVAPRPLDTYDKALHILKDGAFILMGGFMVGWAIWGHPADAGTWHYAKDGFIFFAGLWLAWSSVQGLAKGLYPRQGGDWK